MPHYHFHLADNGPVRFDPEGQDLPNIEAAREHALRLVRGPLSKELAQRSDGLRVEVIEDLEKGTRLVLLVPFPYRISEDNPSRLARLKQLMARSRPTA